jgi:UDPglucose 6-dehydrogenase/GDP-mannose 6-dehydrogenase
VLGGVHLDRRWSPQVDGQRISPGILAYLAAGAGFGGSCFPKDVRALVAHGEDRGVAMPLLRSVLTINDQQPQQLIGLLRGQLDLRGARVTVLGAAFKPGTDDVRESPALRVVPALLAAGAHVQVHDPVALSNLRATLAADLPVTYEPDLHLALAAADAVVIVTAWEDYRRLPELLDGRDVVVADGRRIIPPDAVARYVGIGHPVESSLGSSA